MKLNQITTAVSRMFHLSRAGEVVSSPRGASVASGGRLFTAESLDQAVFFLTSVGDPDVVLEKLGRTRADLRSMEGDDEISQALDTRREAVLGTPWRMEPGEGEITEWVKEQLTPHLERTINGAWSAVPYGYSFIRPVYKEPDGTGLIGGLADVEELEFERFGWHSGGHWLRSESSTGARIPLLPWETDYLYFATVRRRTVRNPYGEALLSRAYWPWYFRHNGWRFWMQFLERFGTPLLLGKTQGSAQDMVDALIMAVQDAAIAVGRDDDVSAISVPGNGEAFAKADEALVSRIQRLILGQTASSGEAKGLSKGQMQENVRQDKRNADIRLVTPTVQLLVNALVALRFGPSAEVPTFVMEDGKGVQVERSERDSNLAKNGIVKFTKEYLLRVYDFDDGDIEIPPASPAQPPALSRQQRLSASLLLAKGKGKGQRFSPDQEDLEALTDIALADAASPIPAATIRSVILKSDGPEDLAERLGDLYRGEDSAEFQELVERTLFAADVLGYVNAETARGV